MAVVISCYAIVELLDSNQWLDLTLQSDRIQGFERFDQSHLVFWHQRAYVIISGFIGELITIFID
jgi:hypothetical protein